MISSFFLQIQPYVVVGKDFPKIYFGLTITGGKMGIFHEILQTDSDVVYPARG